MKVLSYLGKRGKTPPCCESGSWVALRFSARGKILHVSQWIHVRFSPALRTEYQPNLHFLATGRFCLASLVVIALGGCMHRYVDPPTPVHEGSFLVHVVKAPDESLPKILTWYTGTTLSQQIVLRYNPTLTQREPRVGDRVIIPTELVANHNPYGTAPQMGQGKTPNLLMGETGHETKPPPAQKVEPPAPAQSQSDATGVLPPLQLETFADDTSPDKADAEANGINALPKGDSGVEPFQKQVVDEQRELERLQAAKPTAVGDEDLPPPGLLQEFEGS